MPTDSSAKPIHNPDASATVSKTATKTAGIESRRNPNEHADDPAHYGRVEKDPIEVAHLHVAIDDEADHEGVHNGQHARLGRRYDTAKNATEDDEGHAERYNRLPQLPSGITAPAAARTILRKVTSSSAFQSYHHAWQ